MWRRSFRNFIRRLKDARFGPKVDFPTSVPPPLQQALQHSLDESIRNVTSPLLAAAVRNEMNNISLQIDRLIRLNAPVILPSLTNGHDSYQSMVRAFLRMLKPRTALSAAKMALKSNGLPSIVVLSPNPRKLALLRLMPRGASKSQWTFSDHQAVEVPAEEDAAGLKEAIRRARESDCEPVLYVDLNGAELAFIDGIDAALLGEFTQVILVIYDLSNLHAANFLQAAAKAIDKIETKFCCIHIHARNTGGLCSVQNIALPNIVELTYANKEKYKFADANEVYPTNLDVPTANNMPDIYLGNFVY